MGISDASTVCHKNSPIVSPALCGVIDGCLFIGISPDRMDSLQREPGRTEQSCSEFEDACDAKKTVAVHDDGIVEIISPFALTFKIPFH